MYNEYVEVLVQRRVAGWTAVCRIILIVCTLVSLAAGVIFNPLLLIAAAVFFFLDLLIFPEMSVEYEYLYWGNRLDIDKIYLKSRRKQAVSCDLSRMELMAPEGGNRLREALQRPCRVRNFTSGVPEAAVYGIVVNEAGIRQCLLIEPGGELLGAMERKIAGKVFCD